MGGGGGGFFTFALMAVGAIVGGLLFAPAIPALPALASAGVAGASATGVAAAGILGTTTLVGSIAAGAAVGALAGTMMGGVMGNDQKVPDTQMPSFSTINYKDGLDTLNEPAVTAPTYDEAADEARRKLDAAQKGTGYAETVLTATTDLGKASVQKKSLLGA